MLKVKPANPKLLILPMGVEIKTKGGLFMPGKVFGQDLELARIVSVSRVVEELNEPDIAKDKIVLVNVHSGFQVTYEGTTMRLVTVADIHAYVELDGEELTEQKPMPSNIEMPEDF